MLLIDKRLTKKKKGKQMRQDISKDQTIDNLVAIRGLKIPTNNKRCNLCVENEPSLNCKKPCDCDHISLELYGCICIHTIRCCIVTSTHCEGFENDKADNCPMLKLREKGKSRIFAHGKTTEAKLYMEVKS